MNDCLEAFRAEADGKIHRFKTADDRAGGRAGWYVFHADGLAAGAFGSWKAGDTRTWCAKPEAELSRAERAAWKRRMVEARAARDAEREREAAEARQRAEDAWSKAQAAGPDSHPYLIKKGVQAHGTRVAGGRLLVPACDLAGDLHSLQLIDGEGVKRFLPGGAVAGHCYRIGEVNGRALLAEGFATAATIREATGEDIGRDDLGGGLVHGSVSGVAHYLGEDEADAIDYARTVLAYLPSNSDLQPPTYAYAATRADRDVAKRLATIVPDNDRQPYDVLDVIRCIVDYGEFVQVHELFASSAVVGFACVNGHPVGIVANQPNVNAGILDVDSSEKVARFVRLCDAFNLPVVTLVDTPGYKPGAEQEHAGIIRRGAKVIYAYANAQVPLVTVILRKAFGGAYIVMGSKAIGADLNYAWPSSQIAVLGAAGAVNIIHRKDLQKAKDVGKDVEALRAKYVADYERTTVNANLSLEMGEIDAMIDPEQTRETIIESLKLLSSKKRVRKTTKHHGNQPL